MDDADATSGGPAATCQATLASTSLAHFLERRPPSTVVSVSDAQVSEREEMHRHHPVPSLDPAALTL